MRALAYTSRACRTVTTALIQVAWRAAARADIWVNLLGEVARREEAKVGGGGTASLYSCM